MKTIKSILTGLLIISSLTEAGAQQKQSVEANSVIKGIITEMDNSKPVGFANVVLYRQDDSTMVTWSISKEDGAFELTKVPMGTYKVVSTSVGYEKNTIGDVIIHKSGMNSQPG